MTLLKGYKTVLFNGLALGVALTQHYFGALPSIDPEVFATTVAVVNFLLRFVTDSPVFSKS